MGVDLYLLLYLHIVTCADRRPIFFSQNRVDCILKNEGRPMRMITPHCILFPIIDGDRVP